VRLHYAGDLATDAINALVAHMSAHWEG